MPRQIFIEFTANPGSGVAAVEGLADLFNQQFALIEARAARFAADLNSKLSGIVASAQARIPTGGSGSGGATGNSSEVQAQRERDLQATLQRGFALYEQQRQRVAQAAGAIRALGGDTAYTQAQIRNLEKVVDSANGRLLTIRERLAAGATATQAMAISANIAVNRFNQLDTAIGQATERVRAQIAATQAGANGWNQFQQSLGGVKEKLNDISSVLFGVGAALAGAGLAAITAGKSFLESFGEVESSKKALESLGLSVEEIERQYSTLLELAKRPALDPKPLLQYSLQLQQLKINFQDATSIQAAFGNAIARTGGGAVQYQGAIEQVLQSLRSGKLLAEDFKPLFRVLGDLPAALRNAFPKEGADLDALRKSGKGSREVIQAITNEFLKLPQVAGGTKNALENLGIAFDQFKAKLGQALAPVVVPILERISSLLEQIGTQIASAFTALPESVQTAIVYLTGFATALGSALVGLAGIVKVGASFAALFAEGGLLAGIGTFVTGTLAPLLPLLLAIAAAVAALYFAFQTNFLGIRDYVLEAASALQETFGNAITQIKVDFAILSAEVAPALAKVFAVIQTAIAPLIAYWKLVVDTLASVIRIAFIEIKAVFESVYLIVRDGISIIAKLINGDFTGAFKSVGILLEQLQGIFQTAWTAINRIVERAALNILDKLLAVFGKIIEGARAFIDRLGTFFLVTIPNFFLKAAGSALDFVKGFISNLYTAIVRVNEWINSLIVRFVAFQARLFQAGIELGKAIWNGLISFLQQVAEQGLTNVLLGAISRARAAIQNRLRGLTDETAKAASGEAPAAAPGIVTPPVNLTGGVPTGSKGGAKSKAAKSALTDSQEQQINALETQRSLANEIFDRQQSDLERSLKLKQITEAQYTEQLTELYEARLKRLQQLLDREELIVRSAKGLSVSDRNEKLDKIAEQRRKALEDARKAEQEAGDKLNETERKAQEDHLKRLQQLKDDYDKQRIANIKDQADRLLITNEEAESRVFVIESERLKAQRRAIADERDTLPQGDTAGRQRAEDDLASINQQIDNLRNQQAGKLSDARAKDLIERRAYNEAVKKSNLDLLQGELALLEGNRRNGIIDVDARRANAQQIVDLQKQIVTEESKLAQERIRIEAETLASRAQLMGASQAEVLRIQTEGDERILAEQRRLQAEIVAIGQEALAATTEGTFIGGLVKAADALGQGGLLNAAIENVRRLGSAAGSLMVTLQGFKTLATSTFGVVSAKLGEIVGNFLLTGRTGTNVLGQLTKAGLQYLSNFLKQKAIENAILAHTAFAQGIAAAANPFTAYLAPIYFSAAKAHLVTAALAGGGALGLGLAANAVGGTGAQAAGAQAAGAQASTDEQKKQTEYLREIAERQQKVEIALNIRNEEGILVEKSIRAYNQNGAFTNLLANAGDSIGAYGSTS